MRLLHPALIAGTTMKVEIIIIRIAVPCVVGAG